MQRTIPFTLNDKPAKVTVDNGRMLRWVLRCDLGLTGAKFGCREGICGTCTVIVRLSHKGRHPERAPRLAFMRLLLVRSRWASKNLLFRRNQP